MMYRLAWTGLVVAPLVACEPVGTCEPMVAEDARHRATLVAGWEEFRDHLRVPLCVRRIRTVESLPIPRRFRELEGMNVEVGGRAQLTPTGTLVEIVHTDRPHDAYDILIHELCHTVSFQHETARAAPGWPTVDGLARGRGREEAFAQWCDHGAHGTALVAQIETLRADERAAVTMLLDEVFDASPLGSQPAPAAAWTRTSTVPLRTAPFAGFTTEGALVLEALNGSFQVVDLGTGTPVDSTSAAARRLPAPAEPLAAGISNLTVRDAYRHDDVDFVQAFVSLPNRRRWELTFVHALGAGPVLLAAHDPDEVPIVQVALRPDGMAVQLLHDPDAATLDVRAWSLAP